MLCFTLEHSSPTVPFFCNYSRFLQKQPVEPPQSAGKKDRSSFFVYTRIGACKNSPVWYTLVIKKIEWVKKHNIHSRYAHLGYTHLGYYFWQCTQSNSLIGDYFMLYRALAIFCSILWAGTIIATKFLAAEIPSFAFIFIKYALVVLCLLPFVIQSKEYKNLKTHDIPGIFVLGFLLVIVYNAFFFTALSFAPATSVAIIDAINPIFLMLITTMMGQFIPNRLQFLAFPLGFIGATLIVTHGNMGYAVFTGGIGELFAVSRYVPASSLCFCSKKITYAVFNALPRLYDGTIGTTLGISIHSKPRICERSQASQRTAMGALCFYKYYGKFARPFSLCCGIEA